MIGGLCFDGSGNLRINFICLRATLYNYGHVQCAEPVRCRQQLLGFCPDDSRARQRESVTSMIVLGLQFI